MAREAARKVTILGTAAGESITLTVLTLARLIARHAKVLVVDLSPSSPMISAVSRRSGRAGAGGIDAGASLLFAGDHQGTAIAGSPRKRRTSRLGRALLQSPRLMLAIDALLRVYDHVLLDAGTASICPRSC